MNKAAVHIAVVDDDLSVRTALARLLTASSFSATTYGCASDFIESLKTEVPQCLVVDIHMPDMDGLELQVSLGRAGYQIPTVVITAHDEAQIREQCFAAGASAYLLKPLPDNKLVSAINHALARRRAAL